MLKRVKHCKRLRLQILMKINADMQRVNINSSDKIQSYVQWLGIAQALLMTTTCEVVLSFSQ